MLCSFFFSVVMALLEMNGALFSCLVPLADCSDNNLQKIRPVHPEIEFQNRNLWTHKLSLSGSGKKKKLKFTISFESSTLWNAVQYSDLFYWHRIFFHCPKDVWRVTDMSLKDLKCFPMSKFWKKKNFTNLKCLCAIFSRNLWRSPCSMVTALCRLCACSILQTYTAAGVTLM